MKRFIGFIFKTMAIIISVTCISYSTYLNISKDNKNTNSVGKKVIEEKVEVTDKTVVEKEKTEIPQDEVIESDTKGVVNYMPEETFETKVERLILDKINTERRKVGIKEYSNNSVMTRYAKEKSEDMANNGYFDHKDLSGNLITVKMEKDGVAYTAWAENIAWRTAGEEAEVVAEEFVKSWMNSAGHRENILSNEYTSTGIGVYKNESKIYATEEFYR